MTTCPTLEERIDTLLFTSIGVRSCCPVPKLAVLTSIENKYVSNKLKREFHHVIDSLLATHTPDNALLAAFEMFDKQLEIGKQAEHVGSTATVALLSQQGELWLANLGDSRALVFDSSKKELLATKDHKPDDPDEIDRITRMGGFVTPASRIRGPARVNGILATSRSFGDQELKPHVGAKPDIYGPFTLPKNSVLVLGTDGLFDYWSNDDVARWIKSWTMSSAERFADGLAKTAFQNGSSDNITVLVTIYLGQAACIM